ncbi:hypothetical protein Syun_016917 [Stephania yunnanensis]|uniref:Uncharacterized protein n=1 Tax=Stephania yunnanensis TaxID=152371 RepID=A0AAP0J6X0_9MAGN
MPSRVPQVDGGAAIHRCSRVSYSWARSVIGLGREDFIVIRMARTKNTVSQEETGAQKLKENKEEATHQEDIEERGEQESGEQSEEQSNERTREIKVIVTVRKMKLIMMKEKVEKKKMKVIVVRKVKVEMTRRVGTNEMKTKKMMMMMRKLK